MNLTERQQKSIEKIMGMNESEDLVDAIRSVIWEVNQIHDIDTEEKSPIDLKHEVRARELTVKKLAKILSTLLKLDSSDIINTEEEENPYAM